MILSFMDSFTNIVAVINNLTVELTCRSVNTRSTELAGKGQVERVVRFYMYHILPINDTKQHEEESWAQGQQQRRRRTKHLHRDQHGRGTGGAEANGN